MVFQVRIKHWHAVADWTWSQGDDDVCGICRTAHDGCAPDVKFPGDDSPVVWGACGHAFHLQCIQKWLASTSEHRCPMCRRPWHYKGEEEKDQDEVEAASSQGAAQVEEDQLQGDEEGRADLQADEAEDDGELGSEGEEADLQEPLNGHGWYGADREAPAQDLADEGQGSDYFSEDDLPAAAIDGMHDGRRRRRPASIEPGGVPSFANPGQGRSLFAYLEEEYQGDTGAASGSDIDMQPLSGHGLAPPLGGNHGQGQGEMSAEEHTPPSAGSRFHFAGRMGPGGVRRLDLGAGDADS